MAVDVVALSIEGYKRIMEERTGLDLRDFCGTVEDYTERLRTWAKPWERVVCLVALEECLDERAAAE